MKMKQKRIIILLMILLVVMLILITFLYSQNKKNKDFNELKSEIYDEMKKELIMPNGVFQFKKNYTGKNDVKVFYRSVYSLSRGVIDLSKEKIKNVDKYYEKNKYKIMETFGITSLENFEKFQEYVKSFGELKGYNSANIDTDSIKNTSKYIKFDMTLVYDSDKELKFNVRFMNSDLEKVLVKYSVVE